MDQQLPSWNSDQSLVELVRDVVARRTNGSIHNLEVSVDDGVIVLQGRTSRYYHKQLATSAVLDELAKSSVEIRNGISVH
jgi:hypothetical protein